jgi:hypothetical protein
LFKIIFLPNIGGITIVIRDMEEMPISQHRPSGRVSVPGPKGGNHTRALGSSGLITRSS